MAQTVLVAGLFVFVAHLLELVFERTRVPDILLLMILGAVMGPATGVVDTAAMGQVGEFLSVATLIVILTESGLSLRLSGLAAAVGRALPFALLSMAGAVAAMTGVIALALDLDAWSALLGGLILGGTTSSVVIPLVRELDCSERTVGVLTFESALTDVLCIIGAVSVATGLAEGQGIETTSLLGSASFSVLGAVAVGAAAGIAWAIALSLVQRLRDDMFTTLAFAFVLYGVSELLQISGAISALVFGIALGNIPHSASLRLPGRRDKATRIVPLHHVTRSERRVYHEVVFLLKAFFFFYLGLTVDPQAFGTSLGVIAVVLALVPFVPRLPAVWLLLSRETPRREALLSWVLIPRGLAAAVLAQIPVQLGLPGADVLATLVALMVFLSIAIVAIAVFIVERGALDRAGLTLFRGFADDPVKGETPGSDSEPQSGSPDYP